MNTCETCVHWTRQPDKVYQPMEWQKPVGPPQITRFGICTKLSIGLDEPETDDLLGFNPSHFSEWGDVITTGIQFGCVHHKANPP